ncbi:Protein of unknown function, partial [Gryllus bimaculatus]
AGNDSAGAGDALQTLLQPASQAATEFASDEDVVLDGARALENGSRPSETYKAPFELEESPDEQAAESRAADDLPKAGADGDADDGEDGDSNQGGEDDDGNDSKASEGGEASDGGEKDRDGGTNDGGNSASKWERLLPPGARPAGHYFYYTYNLGADSSSL